MSPDIQCIAITIKYPRPPLFHFTDQHLDQKEVGLIALGAYGPFEASNLARDPPQPAGQRRRQLLDRFPPADATARVPERSTETAAIAVTSANRPEMKTPVNDEDAKPLGVSPSIWRSCAHSNDISPNTTRASTK